jgi:DNA-binding GntR family transcriptional regulator
MANPMYRQIAEDLRAQIESGELQPGQQLPTEIELRERCRASRNTVHDAIKLLTTLGLVEARPGQGSFVATKIHSSSTSPVTAESQQRPEEIAAGLWISVGNEVISRHKKRSIEGTLGRRRPRITRWGSPNGEPLSGSPQNVPEGTALICRRASTSARSAIATGSRLARQTLLKRSSSKLPRDGRSQGTR